jgi:ABC-type antimicrobial peptide transport system permease subunit
LVVRQGVFLTAVGSAIGLTIAAGVSQALAGFLFGLPPIHLPAFVAAALFFLAVGLAASSIPARRATKVDPLSALRCE